MFPRPCVILGLVLLLVASSAAAQVEPAATEGAAIQSDEAQMRTPPPVSGEDYPELTRSEVRSNYLRAGMTFDAAYDDNVLPYNVAKPMHDMIYSVRPTIAFDQALPRLHQTLTYSPGFTFYQRTSARNQADQGATINLQYRLSPHASLIVRDSFLKSSNTLYQATDSVSGAPPSNPEGAIPPIADERRNIANGQISYQFSPNAMVGGGGSATRLIFPNVSQVPGLCDSNTLGGLAFYNFRISSSQYVGANYQYTNSLTCPASRRSQTRTNTAYFFYSLYFGRALSLSISGGPQHFESKMPPLPLTSAWTPALTASLGWQSGHVSVAASYSRTVNGGGGLFGAFHSNSMTSHLRWQLTRDWTIDSQGAYEIHKTVNALFVTAGAGGHTVSGQVTLQRRIGEKLTLETTFQRMHQSYGDIAVLSGSPDSNREGVSLIYHIERPLGR